MAKVLLTGASGYIGGQVLHELSTRLSAASVTAIVRAESKAKLIRDAFPRTRIVLGDLTDKDLLKKEASEASIILNLAATGLLPCAEAIYEGIKLQKTSGPVYWIQISGASALAAEEIASPEFVPGSPSTRVFDDVSGAADIRSTIRAHSFRAVDNYLLDVAAASPNIKTALVFPPIIYGEGQGPVNRRSIQIPELARVTLLRGHGVRVGQGLSRWGDVHIRDIGKLIGALAEAAASHDDRQELWGENGLYLSGVGEMTFGEISTIVAREAQSHGSMKPDHPVEALDKAAADQALPHGSVLFGTNARSNARRARELLRWAPDAASLAQEISRTVAQEAQRLKDDRSAS